MSGKPGCYVPAKTRLDQALVVLEFFPDVEKARRAIMAGQIRVNDLVQDKPGFMVGEDSVITTAEKPRFVGRGGLKLEGALQHFKINVTGFTCLDVGASTGGFTDCLLQNGAAKVWAIDVGHSQLHWKIRSDPRVVVREKLNARHLGRADIPEEIALAVIDVSFISLSLILPPVLALVRSGGVILALIKPQFELPREDVARGGVVRDDELHQKAVRGVENFVRSIGAPVSWDGVVESAILGTEGNKEFFACLRVTSV